jgi:hypothetical protein
VRSDAEKKSLKVRLLMLTAAGFAEAQADEATRLRQMFLDVLDGMEVREGATAEQREAKYSVKKPTFTDQQIEKNKRILAQMKSVYAIQKEKLQKQGVRYSDLYNSYFEKMGWNIYTDLFGDVAITKKTLHDEVRHVGTKEAIAATEAIPTVLNKGVVIFTNQINKDSHETIIVAAPITIGDEPYYMGVMLIRDTNIQRLRMHNVVIERETSTLSTATEKATPTLDKNAPLYMTTILQDALKVKRNLMQETDTEAKHSLRLGEQMDKVRQSLGLEAQNSRLTQKIEDYQQIVRQQDAEIRELQRELSRAGVRIFADGAKVAKTAGRLLQGYGAEGIRGTERRQINDALAGLYNQMANEQLTKDALETEAGEIAEKILKQSKKPPFRAAFLISSGRSPSPGRRVLRRARGTAL